MSLLEALRGGEGGGKRKGKSAWGRREGDRLSEHSLEGRREAELRRERGIEEQSAFYILSRIFKPLENISI